jgi:hypothetical protein
MGKKNKQVKETNTTGNGGASFTSGEGMNYATPKAFSTKKGGMYTKKWGYKLVPKKIKGSGLEVKQLFEAEQAAEFQKARVEIFEQIASELNSIGTMLSNAKNETVDFYNDNPSSREVVYGTDTILDYIKDIKDLLNQE